MYYSFFKYLYNVWTSKTQKKNQSASSKKFKDKFRNELFLILMTKQLDYQII